MQANEQQWTILIVDDHVAAREGLSALLASSGSMPVPHIAGTCQQALDLTASVQPDVIVLDLKLPDCDGVSLVAVLRRLCPRTRIIAISVSSELEMVNGALANGAIAFLPKDSLRHSLLPAIEKAKEKGGAW